MAPTNVSELAARLPALPPRCGPVRLVAVDGPAGSGKTTFAAALARGLGGAPVVHLDDLATHDQLFGWTDRLLQQVVRPLSAGRTAHHQVYDWVRGRFDDRTAAVPPAPVVLVEGVGAGRAAIRPHLSLLVWMDLPEELAHARGRRRDGPQLADFWQHWEAAEAAHFTADPSRPHADLLVREAAPPDRPGDTPGQKSSHRFIWRNADILFTHAR